MRGYKSSVAEYKKSQVDVADQKTLILMLYLVNNLLEVKFVQILDMKIGAPWMQCMLKISHVSSKNRKNM